MGLPILGRVPARDALESRTLEIVRRQTGLLVQLVDDLLDVSRVTRGRIELSTEVLDLAALVTRSCDGMRARAMAPREQPLAVSVPGGPVLVRGDANRLEQVLTNLLDNASKYSDPGTRIEVVVEVAGGRAAVTVRDAGIGIAPSALPTVFELFAQEPTSLARSRGGLGIGLTLVKVRRVRARAGRPIRLIALSGYGSAEHRERAFEAGFDEHIAKPITHAQLRGCLAAVAR